MKNKTKKQKEEYKLQFEKDHLKQGKNVYDTYLKAMVKYNMPSTAYASIMAQELYDTELRRLMQKSRDTDKAFMSFMFGLPRKRKPTEIELIKEEIEYIDKLIKQAEYKIDNWTDDIKMKSAKDSVEKMYHWLNFSNVERKIDEEIEAEKKKLKKKTVKRTVRKKKSITVKKLKYGMKK